MDTKPYVIVMGRNYTSRLGMIRAAGQAGYRVAVIKTDKNKKTYKKKDQIDSCSKYVEKYYCLKEPDEDGLIDLLMKEFASGQNTPILLPTDDYTAAAVDKNIDRLRGSFLYPGIHDRQGQVVRYMDKALQKELAEQAGLNVAKGWSVTFQNGAYFIPEDIEFPCFIKPETSFKGSKHIMQKCENREELVKIISKIRFEDQAVLLVEKNINIIKEFAVLGYADGDKVIMPEIISIEDMYLGVAAYGKIRSLSEMPEIYSKLKEMIRKIGFTGLFDIDLYTDGENIYFNELNLRFGASGYTVLKTWDNMPRMLIHTLCGQAEEASDEKLSREEWTFANEKVCFQKYTSGQITLNEYRSIMNRVDFTLVHDQEDPAPGKSMDRMILNKKIKKTVKKLLRH